MNALPALPSPKHLYSKTYGCQMNTYDSQRMEAALMLLGFVTTPHPEEADLVLLNTCHIRAKAEDKLFSDLGRLWQIKQERQKQNQSTMIVVAGCVGQALGASIIARAPYVDGVVGPQTYHTLPEMVLRWHREKKVPSVVLGFPQVKKFDKISPVQGLRGVQAYLSIQEGCNKFCRYCVVPYTRGPEYSRSVESVLVEARLLLAQGAKEITLLGQNVNAYHGIDAQGKERSLGYLLFALGALPGLARLRYLTSHPRDVSEDLIQAHRDLPVLMPLLHLPVQSGSDVILSRMNRQYTRSDYLRLLERFRMANPKMVFSSDFIVGYPGEEKEHFQATCDLIQRERFAQSFSFKYSPRPGTPACLLPQVPETVKNERLQYLQALLNQQRKTFNDQFLGKPLEILVEKMEGQKGIGRSPFLHTVHFIGSTTSQIGDLISVVIEKSFPNSLMASPLHSHSALGHTPSFARQP